MEQFVWTGWNLASARRVLDPTPYPYRLEGRPGTAATLVITQDEDELVAPPGALVFWDGSRFTVEAKGGQR